MKIKKQIKIPDFSISFPFIKIEMKLKDKRMNVIIGIPRA